MPYAQLYHDKHSDHVGRCEVVAQALKIWLWLCHAIVTGCNGTEWPVHNALAEGTGWDDSKVVPILEVLNW